MKYPAIKCSKCENNIPSFMSDVLSYEGKEIKAQSCTKCQPPLSEESIKKVYDYIRNKHLN